MIKLKYNPFGLIVDQTTICNQRCSFCHRSIDPHRLPLDDKAPAIMPFHLYCRIIDQAADVQSINWLSLCGPMGDPLMVPDIGKRLRYALDKGSFNTVLINSNGQALDQCDGRELLKCCTDLQFSVDSINQKTYDKIHCGGDYEKVIDNIVVLSQLKKKLGHGANINVRFTENEFNYGEWEKFLEFFKEYADNVFRVHVHSFFGVKKELVSMFGASICNQPFEHVNFDYRGRLTTCCLNYKMDPTFGSIEDFSLKELWESPEIERWRADRINITCHNCGGLGGFQQRPDFSPCHDEIEKFTRVKALGEKQYYLQRNADPSVVLRTFQYIARKGQNLYRRIF